MAQEDIKYIDTEDAAEWIYFAVMADYNNDEVVKTIEKALDSLISDEPVITEEDIDEAIDDDLYLAKSSYEQGDVSKEEYEQWLSQSTDREFQRQELLEAGARGDSEDSYAASEFLAALLGNPGIAFDHALEVYGNEFVNQFKKISQDNNENKLRKLLPKAFKALDNFKDNESIKSWGYNGQDKRLWLNSVNQLEEKLLASRG